MSYLKFFAAVVVVGVTVLTVLLRLNKRKKTQSSKPLYQRGYITIHSQILLDQIELSSPLHRDDLGEIVRQGKNFEAYHIYQIEFATGFPSDVARIISLMCQMTCPHDPITHLFDEECDTRWMFIGKDKTEKRIVSFMKECGCEKLVLRPGDYRDCFSKMFFSPHLVEIYRHIRGPIMPFWRPQTTATHPFGWMNF